MSVTAEQVAESLINGNLVHDNAILHLHQAGLMEEVETIIKAKGFELAHESDYYVCKGHTKLMAAKVAKDAADKAAAAAALAAEKAEAAKVMAEQAAEAAKAAATSPVGDVDAERRAWDERHGLKPGEYETLSEERKAELNAQP